MADISTPKSEHETMVQTAARCRTLAGGTDAMRAAGETYLPKEPGESDAAYKNRKSRSYLYNVFGKAIRTLNGKLFSKPVEIDGDASDVLGEWLEDCDLQGQNIDRFLQSVVKDAMEVGLSHVLVDMPPAVKDTDGNTRTLNAAEEKALNRRPYYIHITMENLFYWRSIKGVLEEIRIMERITEMGGEWTEEFIDQIRVLRPGHWSVYRKGTGVNKDKWLLYEEGKTTLAFIPLVTVYTNRKKHMVAESPLLDLADLNIAHWQSASDQRHILHVARVPILVATGVDVSDELTLTVGPNSVTKLPEGGDLKYVEHTGAAIGAGASDLVSLEERMATLAMEPFVQKSGTQTATAKAIDSAESTSALQDIHQSIKDSADLLLEYTGAYVNMTKAQSPTIELHSDFTLNMSDSVGLVELGKARALGDISRPRYLEEFQRRGILKEGFDTEENDKELEKETIQMPPVTPDPTVVPNPANALDTGDNA